MLPNVLRSRIENALALPTRAAVRVKEEGAVGGGCISNATRISTDSGDRYFLKWGSFAPGLFACEARGLSALANAHSVRVPGVIAVDDAAGNDVSWLLLEWLEPGDMSAQSWRALGTALAAMHMQKAERFGWDEANFIGSLPQQNEWRDDWPTFWRELRIGPQLEMAGSALGARERRRMEELLRHVDELAAAGNEDGASLLHGDLWGGNVHGLASGEAALIDPSVYYGHREVDLAMAALFGGFTRDFFDAYQAAWPLLPGSDTRRLLYQLYYLLVHVNLFGGSYVSSTMSVVGRLGF